MQLRTQFPKMGVYWLPSRVVKEEGPKVHLIYICLCHPIDFLTDGTYTLWRMWGRCLESDAGHEVITQVELLRFTKVAFKRCVDIASIQYVFEPNLPDSIKRSLEAAGVWKRDSKDTLLSQKWNKCKWAPLYLLPLTVLQPTHSFHSSKHHCSTWMTIKTEYLLTDSHQLHKTPYLNPKTLQIKPIKASFLFNWKEG